MNSSLWDTLPRINLGIAEKRTIAERLVDALYTHWPALKLAIARSF